MARDPDAIAREIEATRAELAVAIDAIADKVSPKRAAARGAARLKAGVEDVRQRVSGPDDGSTYQVHRALRTDRVAVVAGAVTVVAVIVVVVRRRRRRPATLTERVLRR